MKVKFALVSCCKTKLTHLAKAKDLYISDSFKKMRQYAERNYDDWLILSALHRVLDPNEAVCPYEYTLIGKSKAEKERWAKGIFLYLTIHFKVDAEIHIFAGEDYRKYLVPLLEKAGYTVKVPLKGLGIGQQKSWLKKELSA
jgi:cytoplasmic iron level regulating protein YaaA (DUF328/UPF0246 family)